jgi:hypothetical protein
MEGSIPQSRTTTALYRKLDRHVETPRCLDASTTTGNFFLLLLVIAIVFENVLPGAQVKEEEKNSATVWGVHT